MMPIFFHLQAHLWIAYALFFNGFLLNRICLHYSKQYRDLCKPLEAQVVMSFGFSLAFNGTLLLALDFVDASFSLAIYGLLGLSALCLGVVVRCALYRSWPTDVTKSALVLYALMFVVLFYNGGMIDQVSDAWWHMSLANKIGWANSFNLEYGHLTGVPSRYYPPLWHGNLALLRELSDQGLPAIWNAFTAWGGALKLMAYYLVGLALFKDKGIAVLGALLFALLPGFGNSYMRVSAWPAHIAYVFWFFSLYVAFNIIGQASERLTFTRHLLKVLQNYIALLVLSLILVLIFYSHQFEVLLFVGALFLYLLGLSLTRLFGNGASIMDASQPLYVYVYRCALCALMIIALWVGFKLEERATSTDDYLVLLLPVLIFVTLFLADVVSRKKRLFSKFLVLLILGILLFSVNYTHLVSLFYPDMALPLSGSGERPVVATGWFGSELALPGWHLQLRTGLLWSGVIGAILSLVMVIQKPSPAWVFISINCGFVWLLCVSPYLYTWLSDALAYHSTWRFGMLSFHQLAVAATLALSIQGFYKPSKQHNVEYH